MVPGLLLACSVMSVHASPKAAATPANGAATGQTSTPLDLWVNSAQKEPATPLDLSRPPAQAMPAALMGPPVDPLQFAPAGVKEVVNWIARSRDNARLPFLVLDKPTARVFAFNPSGQFQGDAAVLLGMGVGDVMLAPNATMSQMPPRTRITPAGRFVSQLARDHKGKELLVLDYKAAFSMHPVVKGKPHERRAERLGSITAEDNRISFGCINVPVPFYETVISPAFTGTHGIVYILPETSQASAMFGFTPAVGAVVSGPRQVTPAGPQQVATSTDSMAGQTVSNAAAQ